MFYFTLLSFVALFSLAGLALFGMYVDYKTSQPDYREE